MSSQYEAVSRVPRVQFHLMTVKCILTCPPVLGDPLTLLRQKKPSWRRCRTVVIAPIFPPSLLFSTLLCVWNMLPVASISFKGSPNGSLLPTSLSGDYSRIGVEFHCRFFHFLPAYLRASAAAVAVKGQHFVIVLSAVTADKIPFFFLV